MARPLNATNPFNAACRYGADMLKTHAHLRQVERVPSPSATSIRNGKAQAERPESVAVA